MTRCEQKGNVCKIAHRFRLFLSKGVRSCNGCHSPWLRSFSVIQVAASWYLGRTRRLMHQLSCDSSTRSTVDVLGSLDFFACLAIKKRLTPGKLRSYFSGDEPIEKMDVWAQYICGGACFHPIVVSLVMKPPLSAGCSRRGVKIRLFFRSKEMTKYSTWKENS